MHMCIIVMIEITTGRGSGKHAGSSTQPGLIACNSGSTLSLLLDLLLLY